MTRFAAAVFLLVVASGAASAHPIPNTRYDRTIAVRLTAEGLTVKYTLEVTQLTIWLDGAKLFTPEEIAKLDRTSRGFSAAYAKKIAPELARDLRATVDRQPLAFRVEKIEVEPGEHPRFQFLFQAVWPPGGKSRAFAFEDASFESKPGILALTLDSADPKGGVSLDDVIEPDPKWRDKPAIDLTPEQGLAIRKASARVTLPREIAAGGLAPPSEEAAAPTAETKVTIVEGERPSLAADLLHRGLPALFDSTYGVGALLLAAFLFGAFHAFTPGHGKTLVAAYLVGERGTIGHAVILATATTVAHTGSVIAIAAILWSAYGNNVPGTTQGVLQFAGGLLVAGVGLWLLLRRITGKADHFHLFSSHHHHHGEGHSHTHSHGGGHSHDGGHSHTHSHGDGHSHTHSHDGGSHHHGPPPESAKTTAGWTRLLLMGLGGGLIPCWDAVLLLLAAIALNRVGFALPLLFAFSAGLGAVLVGLGISVVYAHKAGAARFSDSRWFKMLPMVSAALLLALGLWLCREGIQAAAK